MNKNLETLILRVEGLDCDCEVALIDKKLSALARVTEWKADILAKKLTLNFDSSAITSETIIKELETTGMKVIPDSKEKKTGYTTLVERKPHHLAEHLRFSDGHRSCT